MRCSEFIKRLSVGLLMFILVVNFCFPAVSVRAEGEADPNPGESQPLQENETVTPVQVMVPVSVIMQPQMPGAPLPGEDTFPVTVTPVTEGAPGPYSTIIVCEGTGSVDLIFGDYVKPGEYRYQVTIGKSSLSDWIVDDTESVHLVTIVVTENEDGTLSAVSVGEAPTAVKTYLAPMQIDVEVKWPDGGERPVTVYLYETVDGQKTQVGKLTVAQTTGWKGSFTHNELTNLPLHPHGSYIVEEMDLYKFVESHHYNKTDALKWKVTITNEKALPQTGPRTAPISFLFIMGVLCLGSGAWLLGKRRGYE